VAHEHKTDETAEGDEMGTYVVEINEQVGTRYEANLHVWTEAISKDEAEEQYHKRQESTGGTKGHDGHWEFHSAGYSSELKSVYEVTGERATVVRDILYPL